MLFIADCKSSYSLGLKGHSLPKLGGVVLVYIGCYLHWMLAIPSYKEMVRQGTRVKLSAWSHVLVSMFANHFVSFFLAGSSQMLIIRRW